MSPLPLLLLVFGLVWLPAEWRAVLLFDRAAIFSGEAWRLLSGHFLHLDLFHALLNGLSLWLIHHLFLGDRRSDAWLPVLLGSMLMVSGGLLCCNPEVGWYVGLSGALHGLFLWGVWTAPRACRLSVAFGLTLLLVIKIVWEQGVGGTLVPGGWFSGAVIVDAHLYGALAGMVSLIIEWLPTPRRDCAHHGKICI